MSQLNTGKPVAIITGGGRGMGAAIARELKTRGYDLSLLSPSVSAITLAEDLDALGQQGSTAKLQDLERLVETTISSGLKVTRPSCCRSKGWPVWQLQRCWSKAAAHL